MITGNVVRVSLTPGRTDRILVELEHEQYPFHSFSADAMVTCNGHKVDAFTLLRWLGEHRCSVTLHPAAEQYGVSLQTDFVSVDAAGK